MAAPHVAGVAALIISQTGMKGGAVAAALQQATNPLPCPDTSQPIYANFPGFNSEAPQTCTGGLNHNSFYGSGEIDALQAVSQGSGDAGRRRASRHSAPPHKPDGGYCPRAPTSRQRDAGSRPWGSLTQWAM